MGQPFCAFHFAFHLVDLLGLARVSVALRRWSGPQAALAGLWRGGAAAAGVWRPVRLVGGGWRESLARQAPVASAVEKGRSKPWTSTRKRGRSERQWHGRVARSQAHHICVQARGKRPERRATPTASCRPLALKTGRRPRGSRGRHLRWRLVGRGCCVVRGCGGAELAALGGRQHRTVCFCLWGSSFVLFSFDRIDF